MLSMFQRLDAWLSSMLLLREALTSPSVRMCFLMIEWAGHEILWLLLAGFGCLYVIRKRYHRRIQWKWCVLLFGLILDLAGIVFFKLLFQRNRPPYNENDNILDAPIIDDFSFPSGHSSRAALIAVLGFYLFAPSKFHCRLLFYVFPLVVGFTRIAMGRHYLFDVLAGFVLGYCEGLISLQLPHATPKLLYTYLPIIFVE